MEQEKKNNRTELVFILDRSGSMGGLESDTIGGFNSTLEKQKKAEGEARVTTVLFDGEYEVLHDRIPVNEVRPLTNEDYYVRGCTALLDAVGRTIERITRAQKASNGRLGPKPATRTRSTPDARHCATNGAMSPIAGDGSSTPESVSLAA